MITLAKVKSSTIENAQRILKVLQFGAKTAMECAPFGEDSCPLPEMTAIYANTGANGDEVILGYINTNQLAQTGEKRLYSLKEDGSLGTFVWLKNDGTMELGGNSKNLVRYQDLEAAMNAEVDLINNQLLTIALAISNLGGTYVPTPITLNLLAAKIEELKCL